MYKLIELWRTSGTKLLGFLQVTLGVLSASMGVFPESWLKYMIVASGLLTAWRGYVNSAAGR